MDENNAYHIYGKCVAHRDLKFQNILTGPDGHAVITDFGISRTFAPNDCGDAIADPVQTIVHMQDGRKPVMGSLGYMVPELEMGPAAIGKSDWYALGVMIFRLLTGNGASLGRMWRRNPSSVKTRSVRSRPAWNDALSLSAVDSLSVKVRQCQCRNGIC